MILTATALALLLDARDCLPEKMRPVMVGIALNEHGGGPINTDAIHHNPNGTDDFGAGQVNTINMVWTGLDRGNWRDPCQNLTAAMKVLFKNYNGNPPDYLKVKYAAGAEAAIRKVSAEPPDDNKPSPDPVPVLRDALHDSGGLTDLLVHPKKPEPLPPQPEEYP